MICPKCGTRYDSKYCPECGSTAQGQKNMQSAATKQSLSTGITLLIIFCAIALMALIAAIAYGVTQNRVKRALQDSEKAISQLYEATPFLAKQDIPEASPDNSKGNVASPDVSVTVLDKINIPEDWDSGRFSPRVEYVLLVENGFQKDVKGIQGYIYVKDLFGVRFLKSQCDLVGQTVGVGETAEFDNMGMDINEFNSEQVKLYTTDYTDLIFEYTITQIVFADGTSEEY